MEKTHRNRDQVHLLPLEAVESCRQGYFTGTTSSMTDMHNEGRRKKTPTSTMRSQHSRGVGWSVHPKNYILTTTPKQLFVIPSNHKLYYQTILCIIIYSFLIISCVVQPAHQQNSHLCPKVCNCDEQHHEVHCNGPFEASGIPHTLDPNTRKMVINHAQTSKFMGSDLAMYEAVEILDIAFNKLTSIDFDNIKSNAHLVTLNVSHNSIVDLRDTALSSVISKHGGNDQRSQFTIGISMSIPPDELKKLRKSKINVMELDLSYNQITMLGNYLFMRWHKLQRLDLSHNLLATLEQESLFGLNHLEYINLKRNQLIQVPALALQATTRSMNNIGSPSDGLMSALRTIDLSENNLVSVDANSFNLLGQAQTVNMDACSIRSIDDQAFDGLSSVTTLSLAQNNLVQVPSEALSYAGSLKLLDMNANDINIISSYSFRNLHNLEELRLENGSLRIIEAQAFHGLNSLKKLDLSHNPNLSEINPTLFDNLPKLTYLNLYMCSLKSLPATESITDHAITILDLRVNSLNCDCDLKWLTKQLKKLNETANSVHRNRSILPHLDSKVRTTLLDQPLLNELLNLTCTGPPALAGRLVIDLPDNKLECIKPSSQLNVQIGFASLFIMILTLTAVCMVNFYRNEKHLIGKLKENIVHNRISMMSPYTQELSKNVDHLHRETQLDGLEYEPVDYGPIYTIPGDQYMTSSTQQHHTHQL